MGDKRNKAQHFVQKAYLDEWCFSGNKIWELRKPSQLYPVSTFNTMHERYYNAINPTNQVERSFIFSFIDDTNDFVSRKKINNIFDIITGNAIFNTLKDNRSIYLNTIDFLVWISNVLEYYESCPDIIKNNNEIQESLIYMKRQLVDEFLGGIEKMGHPIISGIISGNRIIESADYENLIYYCCIAFARTQDSGKRITVVNSTLVDLTKIRAILQFVIGLRLGHEMIARHSSLTILINKSDIPFITGSQPCVNMFANPMEEAYKMQLYLPISPIIALLIDESKEKKVGEICIDDSSVIDIYNNKIDSFSSSLFSNEKQILQKYIKKNDCC